MVSTLLVFRIQHTYILLDVRVQGGGGRVNMGVDLKFWGLEFHPPVLKHRQNLLPNRSMIFMENTSIPDSKIVNNSKKMECKRRPDFNEMFITRICDGRESLDSVTGFLG